MRLRALRCPAGDRPLHRSGAHLQARSPILRGDGRLGSRCRGDVLHADHGQFTARDRRAWAAIAETHNDDRVAVLAGVCRPIRSGGERARRFRCCAGLRGESIYRELCERGIEWLLDDRALRPGVKLADAELVGIPFRVTVGARSFADGDVELTERSSRATRHVAVDQAVAETRDRGAGSARLSTSSAVAGTLRGTELRGRALPCRPTAGPEESHMNKRQETMVAIMERRPRTASSGLRCWLMPSLRSPVNSA